jgi:5-methylcytosine-specific restriction endonuclease McrA
VRQATKEILRFQASGWKLSHRDNVPVLHQPDDPPQNALDWLRDYKQREPDKYKRLAYLVMNTPYVAFLRYQSGSQYYQARLNGYENYYRSSAWRSIKMQVLRRDQVCRLCGSNQRLQVHHSSYRFFGRETGNLWVLSALCERCHRLFHQLFAYDPECDCFERLSSRK